MKTYNLHEIMSNAWKMFRTYRDMYEARHDAMWLLTFAEALRKAWATAKAAAEKTAKIAASGIVRMAYAQYKREYAECQTVEGSYDKATKTIEVMTKVLRTFERPAYTAARTSRRPSVTAIRGLCPRCHTYCYGDCMA